MGLLRARQERGASRFEALATLLALWIVAGLFLIGWALQTGRADNATFSLYHVPGYLGLAALVVIVAERLFDRTAGGGFGGRLRSAWAGRSAGERVIAIGTGILLGYLVADIAWGAVFGIGTGLDGRIAPSRLLLPLGLGLVASGWLVGAVAGGHRPGWLGVVSFTAILGVLSFWIGPWHPVATAWAATARTSATDLRTEIWTMAADGGAPTRIVETGGGEVSEPAWSPDGRRLAYVAWTNEDERGLTADIWTVAVDGTDPRRVTDGPEREWLPAWSPDGNWLAFTSREPAATPQPAGLTQPEAGGPPDAISSSAGAWAIYVVHPDGTDRHRLTTAGESMAAVWSPDGTELAYHGTRDGNLDVFVAAADGTGERRVTDDPGADWSPQWSPDGSRLVFTSDRAGNDDVWAVPATGGPATQLTHDPAADQVPVWSPDGARIAFVSDRSGDVEVWSMAADGSDVRNLTRSPGSDDGRWSVGWSPDGSRLVYARWNPPPLDSQPLVRDDLGTIGMLLTALILALVLVAVDALGGLPVGGLTVVLGVSTLIVAAVSDGWRFVPAALLAGAVGDVISWRAAPRVRHAALPAVVPATFVAVLLLTLAVVGDLGWSTTLAAGVVVAAGLLGLGAAAVAVIPTAIARRT